MERSNLSRPFSSRARHLTEHMEMDARGHSSTDRTYQTAEEENEELKAKCHGLEVQLASCLMHVRSATAQISRLAAQNELLASEKTELLKRVERMEAMVGLLAAPPISHGDGLPQTAPSSHAEAYKAGNDEPLSYQPDMSSRAAALLERAISIAVSDPSGRSLPRPDHAVAAARAEAAAGTTVNQHCAGEVATAPVVAPVAVSPAPASMPMVSTAPASTAPASTVIKDGMKRACPTVTDAASFAAARAALRQMGGAAALRAELEGLVGGGGLELNATFTTGCSVLVSLPERSFEPHKLVSFRFEPTGMLPEHIETTEGLLPRTAGVYCRG